MAAGVSETIFEAANRELDKYGCLARGGQIIDASIVRAPRQHIHKGEKALIKEKAMPINWPPGRKSMANPTLVTSYLPTRTNATSWFEKSKPVPPVNMTPFI